MRAPRRYPLPKRAEKRCGVDQGIAKEIDSAGLLAHGIRVIDEPAPLRAKVRTPGPVVLLTLRGRSTEFAIDTASVHPDHAVFAFFDAPVASTRRFDGRWMSVDSGVVLAPPGVVRTLRCEGAWRITAAYVPRTALASFVAVLPTTARILPERRPLDRAMQAFIEQVLAADDQATTIERYAIEQLILEMSGAILLDRVGTDAARHSPHRLLRERAVAVIARECSDPALTPGIVAREVQSSLRQLQVVFAEADNSVAGEIRRQRAHLAKSYLLDSRFDSLSIEQIAQRSGFHSPMSLRRALDEGYGTTPRALRARAHTADAEPARR